MESDPDVIWFVPFARTSGIGGHLSCRGIRDLPSLRADYTAVGLKIKNAQCAAPQADRDFCGRKDISSIVNFLLDD